MSDEDMIGNYIVTVVPVLDRLSAFDVGTEAPIQSVSFSITARALKELPDAAFAGALRSACDNLRAHQRQISMAQRCLQDDIRAHGAVENGYVDRG